MSLLIVFCYPSLAPYKVSHFYTEHQKYSRQGDLRKFLLQVIHGISGAQVEHQSIDFSHLKTIIYLLPWIPQILTREFKITIQTTGCGAKNTEDNVVKKKFKRNKFSACIWLIRKLFMTKQMVYREEMVLTPS